MTEAEFNAAKTSLVAKNEYDAATIVAMINNAGSLVEISADKINLDGDTIFSKLTTGDRHGYISIVGGIHVKNNNGDVVFTTGFNSGSMYSSEGEIGDLTVSNSFVTRSDAQITGDCRIDGDIIIGDPTEYSSPSGPTSDSVTITRDSSNNLNFSNGIIVHGDSIIDDDLDVAGNLSVTGEIAVNSIRVGAQDYGTTGTLVIDGNTITIKEGIITNISGSGWTAGA